MSSLGQFHHLMFPYGKFRRGVLVAMIRYHWFIRLRWLMLLAGVVLLGLDRVLAPTFARPYAIYLCFVSIALINVIWTVLATRILKDVGDADTTTAASFQRVVLFTNGQMAVDLLMLTAILRYAGGLENPMFVFYLFHMLIAALLLRPFNALLQGAWAIMLYAALGFGECFDWITPHYGFMPTSHGTGLHTDWGTVVAGIGVLASGVVGTLYFTLLISSRLDKQENELYEASLECQRSHAAIELLQQRRSRFLQTAAHQLKSPLTGIEMLAKLIYDGVVSSEKVLETTKRIIGRCQAAITQVNELLTLERVEHVEPNRHCEAQTDVAKIVTRVASRFLEQAASKQVDLKVSIASCAGFLSAINDHDLEDCVFNLLDNAIKYTPSSGTVGVALTCDGRELRISIKDTGIGIAEDSVDAIFEPFRRGNEALAANIPGSGLGLAIVREVLSQAGGTVRVESSPGEGSEFVMLLPIAKRVET